jgi:hypothetical protein
MDVLGIFGDFLGMGFCRLLLMLVFAFRNQVLQLDLLLDSTELQ